MSSEVCRCQWCEETRAALERVQLITPGLCRYLRLGTEEQDLLLFILGLMTQAFENLGEALSCPHSEKLH